MALVCMCSRELAALGANGAHDLGPRVAFHLVQ